MYSKNLLLTPAPPPSLYPQQSQSQYSTQPSAVMYSGNNNMNLGVMANNGGNVSQMSGQMSSMNTEQVRELHVGASASWVPPGPLGSCHCDVSMVTGE